MNPTDPIHFIKATRTKSGVSFEPATHTGAGVPAMAENEVALPQSWYSIVLNGVVLIGKTSLQEAVDTLRQFGPFCLRYAEGLTGERYHFCEDDERYEIAYWPLVPMNDTCPVEIIAAVADALGVQHTLEAKPDRQELVRRLRRLSCLLSPENLSWDGERSQSEMQIDAHHINACWDAISVNYGKRISEDDAVRMATTSN